jgi:hypothetical protein
MTAVEISTFRNDLKDGVLNGTFPSIMAWPAKNNPHSMEYNGFSLPKNIDLAPFKDVDNDAIYNPLKGDFPMLEDIAEDDLPAVFYWCIYHDRGTQFSNNGKSMNVEIQQSAWQYDCKNDTILDNTLFFSYKITNKGAKMIDSLFAGIITDIDYCFNKSMIGCAPSQNTFWAYENLTYNQPCNNDYNKYIAPSISLTFLNRPMHSFVAIKGIINFTIF